ncbi:unnamed protein product, partial [Rotaria sordida]
MGDTGSLSTLTSSSSAIHISPSRRIIDYLTLNTDFSGMKLSVSKSSNLSTVTTKSSTSSLGSTGTAHSSIITPSHSPRKLKSIQNMSTLADNSKDVVGGVKERLITKIDPVEMTVKPTIVTVPQDTISVGIISLIITLWKPISSFFSGFIVGCLFAIVTVYVWFRMIINTKVEETAIEEWIDFPALDSMLTKVDKEDKNTYVQ